MKNIFFVICCIIFLQGCTSEELSPANLLIYDDQAGEKHHELVIEFLNLQANEEVIDPLNIFEWASTSHKTNLSKTASFIFDIPNSFDIHFTPESRTKSTSEFVEAYESFDPRAYIDKHEDERNESFNLLLRSILELTDSASSNPVEIASIITDFSEGIVLDSLLDEEKNLIIKKQG